MCFYCIARLIPFQKCCSSNGNAFHLNDDTVFFGSFCWYFVSFLNLFFTKFLKEKIDLSRKNCISSAPYLDLIRSILAQQTTTEASLWKTFKFWPDSGEFNATQFGSFNRDVSLPLDEVDEQSVWSSNETEGPSEEGEILGFRMEDIFGENIATPISRTSTTTSKPADLTFELNAWFEKKRIMAEGIRNAKSDKDILAMIQSGVSES